MSSDFQQIFSACGSRKLPGTWALAGANQASAFSLDFFEKQIRIEEKKEIYIILIIKITNILKNYSFPNTLSAVGIAIGYGLDD
jgi:hypothetical protein